MIKTIKLAQYSPTASVATMAVIANRSTPYFPERNVWIMSINIVNAVNPPMIAIKPKAMGGRSKPNSAINAAAPTPMAIKNLLKRFKRTTCRNEMKQKTVK